MRAPSEHSEGQHGDGLEQPAEGVGFEGQQDEVDQPQCNGHGKTAALEGGHDDSGVVLVVGADSRVMRSPSRQPPAAPAWRTGVAGSATLNPPERSG